MTTDSLIEQLHQASEALIGLLNTVDDERWSGQPCAGVWSIGKDAEHVADGNALHRWIVRVTLGEDSPRKRPAVERQLMTARGTRTETIALLQRATKESAALIARLTNEQLKLEAKPTSSRPRPLAEMIERTLIGHIHHHQEEIQAKLHRLA
jgi:uncharacterized damage-inducible protein DinB